MKALKCQEKSNNLIRLSRLPFREYFIRISGKKSPSDGSQLDKDVAKIVVVVHKAAALICAVIIPESGLGCTFLSEGIVTEPVPFLTVVQFFFMSESEPKATRF